LILRTFVALDTPEVHKTPLTEYLKTWSRAYPQGINWVKPENLHLTLFFLGDTPDNDVKEITPLLQEALAKVAPFELKLTGFELFPAMQPRLLWAKLDATDKRIFALAKQLHYIFSEFGYELEARALKLHITMGRIKAQQLVSTEKEFMAAHLPAETATYDTVTLYSSLLKPDGAVYKPIKRYELI
jgi:RNA 2',3'-cyclic 3'-phosphodiesterase